MICRLLVAVTGIGLLAPPAGIRAQEFAEECAPPDRFDVVVSEVACQRMHSDALGGVTAFSYYVPEGCAGRHCPVLYVMHGTGGSYGVLGPLGPPSDRNAWAKALTFAPPVDPRQDPAPWNYGDPSSWVRVTPIDMVLVGPHNATVPGGYGPRPHTDGGWADWNPRYALGGDSQVYDTPPPRFETSVIDELIPWVDHHLPVGRGREYRAITGHSQGGLGALKLGLQHPDEFAMLSPMAGASIPLGYILGASTVRAVAPGVGAPVQLPYVALPGATSGLYPRDNSVDPQGFVNALRGWFVGLGDPVADEAWWRGNTSQDLAMNARAWAGDVQVLPIDINHNNGLTPLEKGFDPVSSFLELFATYILTVQRVAFDSEDVAYHYETYTGNHDSDYWFPFMRYWLQRMHDRVRHADGSGSPPPAPDRYDYRTISKNFDVWGWHFGVVRDTVEFLEIRDASCNELTLQGSGVVAVTVPAACGSGKNGASTFEVALGPSMATDEHAMASYAGTYGHVVHVDLDPLCPGRSGPHPRGKASSRCRSAPR